MGGSKRLLEEREARLQYGLDVCLKLDAVRECDDHPGSYYEGTGSLEEALEEAESEEDEEAIRDAYNDNTGLDGCPSCDRHDRE